MKIRKKIQLIFGGTVIILMCSVGTLTAFMSAKSNISYAKKDMRNCAELAAENTANQMADYMKVVSVVGEQSILSDFSVPVEQKTALLNNYTEKFGFTSANVLDINGISIIDGTDFSDRDYVQTALAGEVNVSDVTLSKYTNTYGVSIAAPIRDSSQNVTGVVYFRLDTDFLNTVIGDINVSDNSFAYVLDENDMYIVHDDKDLIMSEDAKNALDDSLKNLSDEEVGNVDYTSDKQKMICGYAPIDNTNGWKIVVAAPSHDFQKDINGMIHVLLTADVVAIVVALGMAFILSVSISGAINKVKKALLSVANGELGGGEAYRSKSKDEIGVLLNTTADLIDDLSGMINEVNLILGSIAQYNLDTPDMSTYSGDFNVLSESVNSTKNILAQIVMQLQRSSVNVESGSRQLADAASNLSDGTVTQAASIQNLAAEIDTITESITNTSTNGIEVNEKLINLDTEIKTSNEQMSELLAVVDKVEQMSEDIQKIVGTIDSIAFQTNILALNASVEAARAGSKGKGFAVVAEEVRNLASKCADASKKTSELIDNCIEGITRAKDCADTTFNSLTVIVNNSSDISSKFEDITEEAKNQAEHAKVIRSEIGNISDVVQSNTATTQQTAAASEELSQQAFELKQITSKFHL